MAFLGGSCETRKVFDHYHYIMVGYEQLLILLRILKVRFVHYTVHVFTVYRTLDASDRFEEDLVPQMLNVLGTGEMAWKEEGIIQILGGIYNSK